MTGENELLPCPFCGETAIHMHSNEDRRFFWAECSKCDVEARGADSEADAREQWNRRPSTIQTGDAAQRVRDILYRDFPGDTPIGKTAADILAALASPPGTDSGSFSQAKIPTEGQEAAVVGDPLPATGARAEIRNGQIVISIDVDDLPIIVSGSCATYSLHGLWKVTDAEAFAEDVCGSLNAEKEDGTTRVHIMFDGAFNHAIDQGAEGIEPVTEPEFEAEALRLRRADCQQAAVSTAEQVGTQSPLGDGVNHENPGASQ